MALVLFNQAGLLLVGSTAGMAFCCTTSGWRNIFVRQAVFVVNLPFYWFAWTRMTREFTLKTFVCVGLSLWC